MDSRTAAFVGVAAVLVMTPGADFAVVVRNGLRSRRAGLSTSAGTVTGLLVHTAAAAAGLSAVLAASAVAFTVVKLAGAVYLCWLGARALWASRSRPSPGSPAESAGPGVVVGPLPVRSAFRQGLLTNLLNPKAPLIFLSVLPQFVPAGAPVLPRTLLLSTILVGLAALWYAVLAAAVTRLRLVLTRARVRRRLDQVTGTVLVGLGIRLALEKSPAGVT